MDESAFVSAVFRGAVLWYDCTGVVYVTYDEAILCNAPVSKSFAASCRPRAGRYVGPVQSNRHLAPLTTVHACISSVCTLVADEVDGVLWPAAQHAHTLRQLKEALDDRVVCRANLLETCTSNQFHQRKRKQYKAQPHRA